MLCSEKNPAIRSYGRLYHVKSLCVVRYVLRVGWDMYRKWLIMID